MAFREQIQTIYREGSDAQIELLKAIGKYVREIDTKDSKTISRREDGLLCNDCLFVCIINHFGIVHPFGSSEKYVKVGVDLCLGYFFGDWREAYDFYLGDDFEKTLNRDECRRKLGWDIEFHAGLTLSLLADDDNAIRNLAGWVDWDLIEYIEYIGPPITLNDFKYYVILGMYLSGRSLDSCESAMNDILNGRNRRPKLLLRTLLAIHERDEVAFRKLFIEYVKYYRKQEIEFGSLPECYSIQATILWAVARREGLIVSDPPEDIMELVVTPESIGLT